MRELQYNGFVMVWRLSLQQMKQKNSHKGTQQWRYLFVPALLGWALLIGNPQHEEFSGALRGGTNKRHLVRAVLEGVSMQIVDILDSMTQDAKQPLIELRVDGGMSRNNFMMQLQSDLWMFHVQDQQSWKQPL